MADPVYRLKKTIAPEEDFQSVSRLKKFGAFITALFVGLIYLRTVTPGMQTGDGTELAAAAYVLGVPHPTGYPLYMLITKFWMTLTGGLINEPILQSTILSGVCLAGACGIIYCMLFDCLADKWNDISLKYLSVICISGAVSCGLLRYHWSNAVVTEVYAFQFLIMVAFARVIQQGYKQLRSGHLIVASILLAMGIAHHRMTVVLILPYLLIFYFAWKQRGKVQLKPRLILASFAILFLGATFYLYLPIRSSANPAVNWGAVNSVERFFDHVEGKMYLEQSFMREGRGKDLGGDYLRFLGKMTGQMAAHFTEQILPVTNPSDKFVFYNRYFVSPLGYVWGIFFVLIGFAVVGGMKIYGENKSFFLLAGLAAFGNVGVLYLYNIRDIFDYYLYPFWFGWLLVLIGGIHLFYRSVLKTYPVVSYSFILLPLWVGYSNWQYCDRSNDVEAEILSSVILPNDKEKLPEGSIVITGGDTDIFTMWYRQGVRKERQDVFVFPANFIWQEWYPDTISPSDKQKYRLKFADRVAHDPAEFVEQMDNGIIAQNIDKTPIFTSTADQNVLTVLGQKYHLKVVDSTSANILSNSPMNFSLYKIEKK